MIGPYKLVVVHNSLEDKLNLMGMHGGDSVVTVDCINKDPHWDANSLEKAIESGHFILIHTGSSQSLYDGRRENGKYKIIPLSKTRRIKKEFLEKLRWPWRNR